LLSAIVQYKGPTEYRWFRDGSVIAGETNISLVIPSISQKGTYQIEVKSMSGMFYSKPVSYWPASERPGLKKWEFRTGSFVVSSPAIGFDGTVYVGSDDKKVYALDEATGAKKWEFMTEGSLNFSSPAIGSDGTVYVGSSDNKVYALNGATGSKKWESRTGSHWSSPAIGTDGTVYVGSVDKKVYALDGATGYKKWEFLAGDFVASSPAIGSDGTVYVGGGSMLYALKSESLGLAKSPWPKFRANIQNTGKIPSGFGPLLIIYSPQSGLNLNIPVSPDFDTILEYSTNLNQWSEQQRFGRQSNTPSIVVPLKMDQTKAMEYWRTRNQ